MNKLYGAIALITVGGVIGLTLNTVLVPSNVASAQATDTLEKRVAVLEAEVIDLEANMASNYHVLRGTDLIHTEQLGIMNSRINQLEDRVSLCCDTAPSE